MSKLTTENFDIANAENSKEPIIVLQIEGVPYIFSSGQVYTQIRYDDPGVFYDGTYVYDGLRPLGLDKMKPYIDRKGSSSTISQKAEPWDGRSSVETMNIKLVDVRGEITKLITPGQVIDEILNKKVRVFFGYKNISYPEDYLRIFSGYINEYQTMPGAINLTFTDPSSRRKQQLFNPVQPTTTADMDAVQTTVVMTSNAGLYRTILNAKGINDSSVTIGFIIESEIITYTNSDIVDDQNMSGIVRGAFGSVAAAHASGTTCAPFIQIQDNAITIALKLMLSGLGANSVTNVGLRGIVNTDDGNLVADTITFDQGVDLIRDYGLSAGDFITLSGSVNSPNNAVWTINNFLNNNRSVKVAETGILIREDPPTSTLAAFRSKYDTYPIPAGLRIPMDDVNVAVFEYNRDTFLPIDFKFQIKAEEKSGKDFIDTNIMKPLGAYSLTQGARISMGLTHPPLAQDLTKVLDETNVINPKNIVVRRGLNSTRAFYNSVLFNFNYDIINDAFKNQVYYIDANAENRMQQVSTLQIDVKGLDASLGSQQILNQRADRLLLRYRYSAETIDLETFFSTGNTIDAGDIAVLSDNLTKPILQIPNTETGSRGVTNRIMEVQERTVDISNAKTTLKLLSNNGFSFSDRYAVFSGSSRVQASGANTNTQFLIGDSYSVPFPGQEWKKWSDFLGASIKIHDNDYNYVASTTIVSLDDSNPNLIHVDPPLPFVPVAGDIMEYDDYDNTNNSANAGVKATYAFRSSTATIASGSSSTVFTLDPGFASRYLVGAYVYVRSVDGSRYSNDVIILSIIGNIVTIRPQTGGTDLGFTPQPGDYMLLGGFLDGGASYRFL